MVAKGLLCILGKKTALLVIAELFIVYTLNKTPPSPYFYSSHPTFLTLRGGVYEISVILRTDR